MQKMGKAKEGNACFDRRVVKLLILGIERLVVRFLFLGPKEER
jgi:hypothetical protein